MDRFQYLATGRRREAARAGDAYAATVDLHVTFTSRRDLAGQLHRQIRDAILDARIRSGERLPATRDLAARLGISRYTVGVAYDRLIADGLVEGRAGAGSFVTERPAATTEAAPAPTTLRPLPIWQTMPTLWGVTDTPRYDFRAGLPDAKLFPYTTWRRLTTEQLRGSAVGRGNYGDSAGHSGLRSAIARHVGVSRGVTAGPDDVIVTNGCQQAVDLLVRVLLRPGDTVAIEAPGYVLSRLLLETHGLRVVGVRVDAHGIVVDEIPDDARLVYVTPSHQFPLGLSMSTERRQALLRWAQDHDAAIAEDDYDSEFRYGAGTFDPLHCMDSSGRVVYIGSFSKTMLPGLRLGFMIAPASLRPALRTAKLLTDWHAPLASQAALASFIDTGMFTRHIRSMRRVYQERHRLVSGILRRDFVGLLDPINSSVGLHVAAFTPQLSVRDTNGLAERALENSVGVYALSGFGHGEHQPSGLVIGYGAIATEDIPDGLARLRALLD
jgi:GntR family transcriptional regulator/MocR family aminotransferase